MLLLTVGNSEYEIGAASDNMTFTPNFVKIGHEVIQELKAGTRTDEDSMLISEKENKLINNYTSNVLASELIQ
jgi:hypothetical protein